MQRTIVLGITGLLALVGCEKKREPTPAPTPKVTDQGMMPQTAPAAPLVTPKVTPTKSGSEIAEDYRKCLAAWSNKDGDAYQACWAPTATIEAVDLGNPPLTGSPKEIVDKMMRPSWTAFPDSVDEARLILVNGRKIATIERISGTNKGELKGMPATGKKATFYVAHIGEVDDQGRIVQLRGYGDMGVVMSQLGHGPKMARPLIEASWPDSDGAVASDTATERDNEATAERMRQAFNAHDVAGALALTTDTIIAKSHGTQEESTGQKALEKSLRQFFAAFPDARVDVNEHWAAGEWVVESGTLHATNLGDMPAMKLKKTGKPVTINYLELIRFDKGKVAEVHRFFNGMAMAQQLGMMPAPDTQTKAPDTQTKAPDTQKTQKKAPAAK
jgi:predicted ester cyclase